MNTANASRYTADYQNIAATLPGQQLAWLNELRATALQQFASCGFPSLREEEWRYTNVAGIEKNQFAATSSASSVAIDTDWLKSVQLPDVWSVVVVDGFVDNTLSQLDGIPDSVTVTSMANAIATNPDLLQTHLGQAVSNTEHNFIAFNTAWFADGLFIHVPVKQVLAKPIQILHLNTRIDVLAATRNVIIIDELAQVQLIETFVGNDHAYLTNAVTEVFVGQQAQAEFYKVQIESDKAYHFGGTYVKQARDARFTQHNFALGGLLARTDMHTDLETAAECELNGLYLGVKRQHIDNHTRITHLKPHGVSRELYKGVLDDRARGVFQGRVIVAEDAQKTDSQMNNRNLLLSPDAEADTKPQLEIYADDVKCAHGVTVGQLDEKSVFYLQSRCVDEETARNMLTFAFANEMVDKVKHKNLHDLILTQVLARFPQQGINKEWL